MGSLEGVGGGFLDPHGLSFFLSSLGCSLFFPHWAWTGFQFGRELRCSFIKMIGGATTVERPGSGSFLGASADGKTFTSRYLESKTLIQIEGASNSPFWEVFPWSQGCTKPSARERGSDRLCLSGQVSVPFFDGLPECQRAQFKLPPSLQSSSVRGMRSHSSSNLTESRRHVPPPDPLLWIPILRKLIIHCGTQRKRGVGLPSVENLYAVTNSLSLSPWLALHFGTGGWCFKAFLSLSAAGLR